MNDLDKTYIRTSVFPIAAEIAAGSPIDVPEGIEPTDTVEVPTRYIPFGRTATLPSKSMVTAWSLRFYR